MLRESVAIITFIANLISGNAAGFDQNETALLIQSKQAATAIQQVEPQNSSAQKEVQHRVSRKNASKVTPKLEAKLEKEVKLENYADKITKLGITLHPGSEYTEKDKPTSSSLNHCASLVYNTLNILPSEATNELKSLTLYFADEGRRGLGGGSKIILRCTNVTDLETVGVLTHEVGHIQDTTTFKGNFWAGESEFKDGKQFVYNDDPSVEFYRISFKNEQETKANSSELDFVSGYAATDPFEDFAESYNYYILHGNEFRVLVEQNSALKQKYLFLQERVFKGKEYFNGDLENVANLDQRNYDTTILNYDLSKFFAI